MSYTWLILLLLFCLFNYFFILPWQSFGALCFCVLIHFFFRSTDSVCFYSSQAIFLNPFFVSFFFFFIPSPTLTALQKPFYMFLFSFFLFRLLNSYFLPDNLVEFFQSIYSFFCFVLCVTRFTFLFFLFVFEINVKVLVLLPSGFIAQFRFTFLNTLKKIILCR